ncbi:DUF6764 family protein [Nocardia shimofusensis]|uniref:DUF6764 family protein n=1 Tax=Nocardia shimofusensis TaxID=228596 RepID=UPI00083234FB|nr:DUF6764 family protein [Nocardia shimofusensis]
MNLIRVIICSAAALGTAVTVPATASATPLHCTAERGGDLTRIEGRTGCRAATDEHGRALATGFDGVGYAYAAMGANAFGVGAAGGVGASEGFGGIPIALGFGPDAMALSSVADPVPYDGQQMAVAIAFEGSRAEVGGTTDGTVVCLGAGAFAWNTTSGASCLATPFGQWTPTPPDS